MSPCRALLSSISILLSLLSAAAVGTHAQQAKPKVLAPHRPPAAKLAKPFKWHDPSSLQSAVGGLWMTGPDMKAALYLHNGLKSDSLTVAPILYLSNGVRYPLQPVTLQPSGTSIVDINQGLAQQGIAPYATLYGYAEIEYQWPWAIVSGRIRNVDAAHSLIFLYELQPALENLAMIEGHASKQGQQNLEGMWWKYEPGVNGFMAVSNITAKAINASLRVTDDHDVDLETYQLTVLPHTTKLVTFNELLSTPATAGGIYASHDGPAHALVVNGGLEDQQKGYSANLSLPPAIAPVSPADPSKVSEMSFAEAGLMIGAADPMMRFPVGTEFIPYSVVRNTSSQSASIKPTVWWMDAGKPQSAELSQISIAPHQTVDLNAPSLLAAAGLKGFSGSVNLVLDTTALPGALSLASGSVDKTDTYVFEVTPHGIAESASRAICYWSVGNGDDTMITVWNPADESQDFAFTLFYSSGHYAFPIHLEARATQTFNMSDLIRNQLPDAGGNIIPLAVHDGSAELAGSQAENQQILVSMSGGTYNVNKAICGVTCITCNGVVSDNFFVADNPFSVAITGTKQQTFYEQWNNGSQYSILSNWNSSASGVATVGSTTGLVTGVAPGSATISAQDRSTTEPMYVANYCTPAPICPVYYNPSGQSAGAVPPKLTLSQTSSIFVGTDANLAPPNSIFATVSPSGGTFSESSSEMTDTFTDVVSGGPGWVVKTTKQSTTVGDRTLTIKYTVGEQSITQTLTVTARQFAYITNNSPSNTCTLGHGTTYVMTYTPYTHPDKTAVQAGIGLGGTAVAEAFNPQPPAGTVTGDGALNANSQFVDRLSYCSTSTLSSAPTVTQTISIEGYQVRTNSLAYTSAGITPTSQGPTQ